ncbi:MAG: ORF6N domain-containing protein [Bacilli bacterium]|nr:ORF6N domain-containing protein [Bacilli bacterium]
MRTILQYLVFADDNWPRDPRCAYGHINIVSSKITISGVQVMLDSDIAALFELPVRRINEQMKRNPDRFPEDFCFQLTKEERDRLRSQIVAFTERTRDRKYLPYVFTEQGIIALAGVLRSGLANKMAVEISHVFVSMRRFILENGDLIGAVDY